MYTGRTKQPCCLCGATDTVARIDLPPQALSLLRNGEPIAWQDVVGEASIHFCESDWETVRDLVLETGMSPLPRCNAARAAFDLREDFEALTSIQTEVPDHDELERQCRERAQDVLEQDDPSDRALVEARVVTWALEDLNDEE